MTYRFDPYTSTPSRSDKNFISIDNGGYAGCIPRDSSGYTLPNCVAFVHGMWLKTITEAVSYEEARRIERAMCWGNAENYWDYDDGFKRGQTPKLNAIMVWWGKGSALGHVMTVTKILDNGDVVGTGSDYSGAKFYTQTYYKSQGYNFSSNLIFKGFIYNPYDFVYYTGSPVKRDTTVNQIEVFATTLNVRRTASTKEWSQGFANKGVYNIYEEAENEGYKWYRIGKDMWIANDKGATWCKVYPAERIGKPVERNDSVNQFEITATTLRARTAPSLKGEILGYAAQGFYNNDGVTEADGYKWFSTQGFFVAQNKDGDWVKDLPAVNPTYDLTMKSLSKAQKQAMVVWCEAEQVEYEVKEH